MPSFKKGLPQMVMRVNEARRHDFIRAVNHVGFSWSLNVLSNFGNDISFNQKVSLDGMHMVVFAVSKNSASLKEHWF